MTTQTGRLALKESKPGIEMLKPRGYTTFSLAWIIYIKPYKPAKPLLPLWDNKQVPSNDFSDRLPKYMKFVPSPVLIGSSGIR